MFGGAGSPKQKMEVFKHLGVLEVGLGFFAGEVGVGWMVEDQQASPS